MAVIGGLPSDRYTAQTRSLTSANFASNCRRLTVHCPSSTAVPSAVSEKRLQATTSTPPSFALGFTGRLPRSLPIFAVSQSSASPKSFGRPSFAGGVDPVMSLSRSSF